MQRDPQVGDLCQQIRNGKEYTGYVQFIKDGAIHVRVLEKPSKGERVDDAFLTIPWEGREHLRIIE